MITPNRIGEFYGRVEGWSRKDAIQGAVINSYNGFFQSSVTVIAGIIAMVFAPATWKLGLEEYLSLCIQLFQSSTLLILSVSLLLIALLAFCLGPMTRTLRKLKTNLPKDISTETKGAILGLSALRYLVFSSQFVILLWFFGVDLPIEHLYAGVAIGYFVLFTLPSIALAELGIRELSFTLVFGAMGAEPGAVFTASLILWVVNLFLPSLSGIALYLYGFKSASSGKLDILAKNISSSH
jgi:hypothetical protein